MDQKNIKILMVGAIVVAVVILAGCQPPLGGAPQERWQAGTAVSESSPGSSPWLPFSGGKVEPTVPYLKIKSITPTNEATGVAANTNVVIKFSEPVDQPTISNDNIKLHYINPVLNEDQETISFSTALDSAGEELQLVPSQNYLPGETVELILTCGLKSRHDITLEKSEEAFLNNICYTSKFEVAP